MSENQQTSQIKQMRIYVNYCKQLNEGITMNALQLKLTQIKELNQEFKLNQTIMEEECKDMGSMDVQIGIRSNFNDQYHYCYVTLQDRIMSLEDAKVLENSLLNQSNDNVGAHKQKEVKLPRIELTPFSGNYEDWATFHDLFHSLIHTNTSIDNVQKLHYLKSNVQGDAKVLLKSITITEANYAEAWNKLRNRYDHKRFIVDSLLKSLFCIPSVLNENHKEIKNLIDKASEIIQSLQLQGLPIGQWDVILVHVIVSKLDSETHKQWELKQKKDELPTYKDLEDFLQSRWQSLEMIHKDKATNQSINQSNRTNNYASKSSSSLNSSHSHQRQHNYICSCCNSSNHRLYSCPKYNQLNILERKVIIKDNKLCFNCLHSGHSIVDCNNSSRCKTCNGKHHTSVHVDTGTSSTNNYQNNQTSKDNKTTTAISTSNGSEKHVLLATAIVYIHTRSGEKFPVKALIDQGSQNHLIRNSLVMKLKLNTSSDNSTILGFGDMPIIKSNSSVNFKISSHVDSSFSMEIEASSMNKITGELPFIPIHRKDWYHLKGIKLADMHFDRPSPIDLLLGAEAYEKILLDGIIRKQDDSPTAQNSRFGWLLFGLVKSEPRFLPVADFKNCFMSTKLQQLDDVLRSFWEMEEIPEKRKLTIKEQQAEDIFVKNVHRNQDGRYVVALPFDPEKQSQEIGESKKAALHGLFRLESRFKSNNALKERYKDYIQNLIDAGHIELVPKHRLNIENKDKFYLPHHSVIKEESLTTKLRVVFDASRNSSTGVSLNDKLLVGPKTQDDLYSILIRWRKHKFVFLADIEKMYRQVKIINEHRDYQRLLWRFDENGSILEYRITTVIDGTASASYLATRTLIQLAEDYSTQFPEASKMMKEDFYVDDMSSGSYSVEKAKQLQNDVIEIMNQGKFVLRKWFSNNKDILDNVPEENRHDQSTLVELIEKSVKTLGIYWNQLDDSFEFKIASCSSKHCLTKRELLSDISKIFDPIGWLAPSTVIAKIFMQSLWAIKGLNWDDKVPEDKMETWRNYRDQLHTLEQIKIPRWIGTSEIVNIQLHGFGDASNAAYSAVVYSRVIQSDGLIKVNIMSAKTKVSPLKVISIPKLELCGAVITSRLIAKVKDSLKLPNVECFTYSDNTTVLAWLKSHPNHYNTFVANRITEIQSLTSIKNWFFVSTDDNPADCASRGVLPAELGQHQLWWSGPKWLSEQRNKWPSYESNYVTELEKRKLPSNAFVTVKPQDEDYLIIILKKHSSLSQLVWRTAFVTKFVSKSKSKAPKKVEHPNAQDLRIALQNWIRYIQVSVFQDEVERCKSGDELLSRSKLKKLRPFIDGNGLLRVGGRLSKSELPFKAKHPIILPKNNYLTKLIIEQAHKYTLHGGPTLMSTFMSNYWIFGRTDQIKKVIGSCLVCFPHRCKPTQQLMADLPVNRVIQHRAFLHTGVDFSGPFITKTYTGRSRGIHANPTQKSYISIFICLATKAIHIEFVSDMSTPAFIACYKRFVAIRGKCSDMYSDNGKNFVGANKEIREQFKKLMKDAQLQEYLAKDGTIWHFNPAYGASFGGLWEAGIKSIKYHLKRLLGNNTFTFEEMTTLLHQIGACLNSRPLCPISNDVNDVSYLTPGHFLIGEAPITVPEPNLLDTNINRLSRWQLVQKVYQQFWKYWHTEYLSRLQQRSKWLKEQENVQAGQLVLMHEENVMPAKWPVARILKVYPGDDKRVRVVNLERHTTSIKPPIPKDFDKYLAKMKTHKSVVSRPISRISILPIQDNFQNII